MKRQKGDAYINKIAAAKRQLEAAIRLFFADEDPLAIHTVAAAATRVLQDIIGTRGGTLSSHVLQNGFYAAAKRYADSKMSDAEVQFLKESGLFKLIETIATNIKKQGVKFDRSQIKVESTPNYERQIWPNDIANFLKHADRDPGGHMALTDLDNESVLIRGSTAYLQIMKEPTPVYGAWWVTKNDEEHAKRFQGGDSSELDPR
jgi:hypothetical protein